MPAENLYDREERELVVPGSGDRSETEMSNESAPKSQTIFKKAIKVIAVGGGGGNALNHIISRGIEGVDMLAVNTDIRSLEMSLCDSKIILGEQVTKGLGAGAVPEVGERAALESINDIRAYLKGTDMVYLAAGMGGGTGTGAIPIIARAAKEMGILTVAVVTKPFSFEGKRRRRYAEEGIEKLFPEVDALIVVPNDRLLDISHKTTPLMEAFPLADEILRQAVQGVTDLVTRPGLVNVDFADLKTVMRGAGRSVMGIGTANGEDCVIKAVKNALESPLMECSMHGAKGVLMNITYKGELPLYEISRAAEIVEDVISDDANFIWGCVADPLIENDVEITVVAAGFDESQGSVTPPVKNEKPKASFETVKAETVTVVYEEAAAAVQPEEAVEVTPAPRYERRRPLEREAHIPAWLLEEEPVETKAADNKKPTTYTKPSTYEVYENPTFVRRGNSLKKPQ
ncbi:cell division protein FtsZ [Cloacibacillus sp.]